MVDLLVIAAVRAIFPFDVGAASVRLESRSDNALSGDTNDH